MTTERATPPAGFDTHAEVRRMTGAGLTEEQGAAAIYAAIAAADARNAELRKESDARYAELRKDMAHMSTRIRLWIAISAGGSVIATVTLLQFLRNWPG